MELECCRLCMYDDYWTLLLSNSVFVSAVRLVKVRSEAMQRASEEVPSGMMTVFFRSDAKIPYACHAARLYCSKELQLPEPVCEVSNYLYPGCKVISGNIQVTIDPTPVLFPHCFILASCCLILCGAFEAYFVYL